MGAEILQWALGAIATGATTIGAIKSLHHPGVAGNTESVSLSHPVAQCWCGQDAISFDGEEMRWFCEKHSAGQPQEVQTQILPQTDELLLGPEAFCEHDRVIGHCRDCYLDERYRQQQARQRQSQLQQRPQRPMRGSRGNQR